MNRKIIKLIMIMMLLIQIICIFKTPIVEATSGKDLAQKFNGSNVKDTEISDGTSIITKVVKPVLSAIRIASVGIGVIVISILGIKYMIAAPDEKASIKNQLIYFTIGAVVVFAATSILSIIQNAADTAIKA